MTRLHGKLGQLYVGIALAGTAQAIAFLDKWTAAFTTNNVDVTAFGDRNRVYVAGLPDAKGTFSGFYDNATAQLYTASQDGVARRFYLYPNVSRTLQYWFGTGLFDFSVAGGVSLAVSVSGNWAAASSIIKVG